MGKRTTGIEWTAHTWNPFVGCTIQSAGCAHCYAMKMAARIERFGNTKVYDGTTRIANGHPVWTGKINRSSDATFAKPLGIREPSLVFVNSMSDFWHPNASDEWRLDALKIMAATAHQYQVLTKVPEHIAPFLERTGVALPDNFWLGTTVERADFRHRIDTIRAIPARIRFLSCEPLLGPLTGLDLTGIHWVIVGGESGKGARHMEAAWVREIRSACQAAGVAFFFKQWGTPESNPLFLLAPYGFTGRQWVARNDRGAHGGCRLDGREWKDFPGFESQPSLL